MFLSARIARSIVENIADVKVYLDGNQLNYTATSLDDSWLLYFTYLHSTHKITITLCQASSPFIETPLGKAILYAVSITATAILTVRYISIKKKRRSLLLNQTTNLTRPATAS